MKTLILPFSLAISIAASAAVPQLAVRSESTDTPPYPIERITRADVEEKEVSVTLTKAGTLSDYISDADKYIITSLKIIGPINGTDVRLIRDMADVDAAYNHTDGILSHLDLSEAVIESGGDWFAEDYYDSPNGIDGKAYTVDNEICPLMFAGCMTLTEVIMPPTVTSIGANAFNVCGLTSVDIPSTVTFIGNQAFISNPLSEINISSNVETVDEYAFAYCNNLESVTLDARHIGENAFFLCRQIKEVSLGANVETIGYWTFPGAFYINEYKVSPDNQYFTSWKGALMTKDMKTLRMVPSATIGDYTIPDGVETIGTAAFAYCHGDLGTVTLPSSVKVMDDYAFNTATLQTIKLNEGLERIGDSALAFCPVIKEVSLPSTVKELGYRVFWSTQLTKLELNEGLESIGTEAFAYTYLTEVTIPSTVKSIGALLFNESPTIHDINVADGNEWYTSIDGTLYTKGLSHLVWHPYTRTEDFVIPEGVQTVDERACSYGQMTTISFPSSLRTIGPSAFYACQYVTEIDIPDGLETIERMGFNSCTALKTLSLPSTLKEIGAYAFAWITYLESVTCNALTPPACPGEDGEVPTQFQSGYTDEGQPLWVDAKLFVPAESIETYRTADGWKNFELIHTTAVGNISTDINATEIARYDLAGRRVGADYKGIVIVRYSDGTSRRILEK